MAASTLLNQAEGIDGYRAACSASFSNAVARKSCIYTPAMVSQKEADRLLAAVDRIDLLNSANVIVMNPAAENGYPHTRPLDIVCMPTTSIEGVSTDVLENTLRHEAIHLHQRANPETWVAICRKEGWEPIQPAAIPLRLRGRCRLNPDTFRPHQFWAWRSRHVPLPLFSTDSPSNLGDVVVKWYDLEEGRLLSSSPQSFKARYGLAPSQPEHPFELLAVEAADRGVSSEKELMINLNKE